MASLITSHAQDGDSADEFMAEINIIPLVDVMLVLLIIFMVAAPLSLSGMNVQVPQVSPGAGDSLRQQNHRMVITVEQDGTTFYNEQAVDRNQLTTLFTQTAANQDQAQQSVSVIIQADQAVMYATVVAVMNLAKSAGLHRIGLVVAPSPP